MSPLEGAAALLGLVNVALVVRRSLWNYPFGIAMVLLYGFVFYEARLYSDALLQVFFLVIQLYGWWAWARSGRIEGGVAVSRLSTTARLLWIAGTALAAFAWGSMMARFTDAAAPFIDAAVAGTSVAAQILQSRRKVESWVLWILVDVVAIGLFWSRELIATSVLYGVFLVMSAAGLVAWARIVRRQEVRS